MRTLTEEAVLRLMKEVHHRHRATTGLPEHQVTTAAVHRRQGHPEEEAG